jgi:hypothetical protein
MDTRAPPPTAKASGFNSVVKVLRDMIPAPEFANLVKRLPPATAALVGSPPMPVEWLPVEHYAYVVSTALYTCFDGDELKIVDMGRRAMLIDLKTMYRLFIRILAPTYVLERSSNLWLTYNRNNGTLRAVQTGDASCDVHYQGVLGLYPGFWAYQRGAILAVGQATGYRNVEVKLARGGRLEGNAVFTVTWSS